ncbi:MAG: hypothetical protein IJ934_08065 [Acetobacter sp.]|nr:hypothetical protein [Acetobacter sp.]
MRKHFLVTLTSILLVCCMIWLGTRRAEHIMLDRHIDILRQSLGQGVFLTYDSARSGLLGRSTVFTNVIFRRKNDTITVQQAELSRPDSNNMSGINHLSFHNVQITGVDGNLKAELLTIDDLVLLPHGQKQARTIRLPSIAHAHAYGVRGFIKALHAQIAADSVTLDHFNGTITDQLLIKNILLSVNTGTWRRFTIKTTHASGFNIAKLYWSLYHGIPLYNGVPTTAQPGQRDIEMHQIEIDGETTNQSGTTPTPSTTPLLRISNLSSHITLTKALEQETSNIQGIEIWPITPGFHWIAPLKYDHLHASIAFNNAYNLQTKLLHVKDLNITVPTIGRMRFHGDFTHSPIHFSMSSPLEFSTYSPISPILSRISPDVQIAFPDIYVVSMAFTYFDYGFITRALKAMATESHTTPHHLLETLFPGISLDPLPIAPKEQKESLAQTTLTDIHTVRELNLGTEKTSVDTSHTPPSDNALQKIADYLAHPTSRYLVINSHPAQPFSVQSILSTLSTKRNSLGEVLPQMAQKIGLSVTEP